MTHDQQTLLTQWSAFSECWKHRRLYAITCGITLLVALVITWCMPTMYAASVKIADEPKESDIIIGLTESNALQQNSNKALNDHEVYPLILDSRKFINALANVHINDSMRYADHIRQQMAQSVWHRVMFMFDAAPDTTSHILNYIQDCLRYNISVKYYTITLEVSDTDPVVAAMMVDSARVVLQRQINEHNTALNTVAYQHALEQRRAAAENYHDAQRKFAEYSDSHTDATNSTERSKLDELQKELDMAFSWYQNVSEQCSRAEAMLQKSSSTFAILKNATVPQTPSSPNTAAYLTALTFIAFVATTWYVLLRKTIETRTGKS